MRQAGKSSISRRFTIALLAVVAAIVLVYSSAVIIYSSRDMEARLHATLQNASNLAQVSLSTALWEFNTAYVHDFVNSLFLYEDVVYARVYAEGKPLVTKHRPVLDADGAPVVREESDLISRATPILHHGRPVGRIEIAVSTARINQSVIQVSAVAVGLGLLLLAAIIITVYLVSRTYVFRPIARLGGAAANIARGEFKTPIDVNEPGELGHLALDLDRMRESLDQLFEKARQTDELARLNKELQGERDRAQRYLDVAGVMILALDSEHRVSLINSRGCHILGYPEEEILKRNWFDGFLISERMTRIKAGYESLMRGEIDITEFSESEVRTRTGDARLIAWHNSILTDEHGQPTGTLSSGEDITDRRRAEDERRALAGQLRQSQKMEAIGTLAGGVAHDFNNILSAIIGFSELSLDDLEDDHPVRDNLEQVLESSWRARNLVGQLLAFSRKQTLEMKTFGFNDIVGHNLSMYKRILGEDIDLEVVLDPDSGVIKADFHQFEQVLLNLVANARDAMPAGGRLTIETAPIYLDDSYTADHADASPGHHVMLAVSDNGPGMDEETRQRMFDPFFTTKETGKGTGMGLAMVYGIVKQHRGNIYVYSEPGQGTTFKIYMPRVDEEPELTLEPREVDDLKGGSETVLVVEDEEAVRNFIVRALEKLGYNVLAAEHGRDALEVLARTDVSPDLLITDVVMPRMNGRELHDRLAETMPGLRVIYISGYTDNVIAHHGVLDRGLAFLQKPVSVATLAHNVRRVLDKPV